MSPGKNIDLLEHTIDGFLIRNADKAVDFYPSLLGYITDMVIDGKWSEEARPEAFARLRKVLTEGKTWFLSHVYLVEEIEAQRTQVPRAHWWWWIEEL